MKFKIIIVFFLLISYSCADDINGNNTDIFSTFTPLPENPKNTTRYYTLELKKVQSAPDGYSRTILSVNGQYPGPIIFANIWDRLVITVVNNIEVQTSVHWHGIDQVGTNWYDGVPGVTQCLIQSGANFTYAFNLTQSGTYWYHSHYRGQLLDGLRGPIVIFDPDDPNKNLSDYEYVMTVGDWYHYQTDEPGFSNATDPLPDSAEISGVGQYNCTITDCVDQKFATYKVEENKRYRFRIINVSAMSHFRVSVDQHPLTITEIDGTSINPYTVEILSINIGQRYSVIIEANQKSGNYWIRASISECSVPPPQIIIGGILSYNNVSTSILPTSEAYTTDSTDCHDPDAINLKPYPLVPPVPQDTNLTRLTFQINVVAISDVQAIATINNSSYTPNYTYPSIKKVMNDIDFLPTDNSYSYYNLNEPVEITIVNIENRPHPFHMHGHSFWIVAQGLASELSSLTYNFDNPPFRDTVTVNELGYIVIRYFANNPGVWLIHCHIQWHFAMGMIAQLVEIPAVFKTYTIPQNVLDLCNN